MAVFRYTWRTFARELVMLAGAVLFCLPIFLLFSISLKTTSGAYVSPLSLPHHPQWSNYSEAWKPSGGAIGLGRALRNSVIITVGSVVCLIACGSVAAYALARRTTRLSVVLYSFFVLGIVIPVQLASLPLYSALHRVHLDGTYIGMILLYTGLLMPLTVFLYTGFIRALPRDYEEAARVDGASRLRVLVRVVMPLLKPVTGTVAVLTGLIVWNDFFVPLIFLGGRPNATLPVAVYQLAAGDVAQWNVIFAAVVISIIPMLVFYVFAQQQLVRGFTSGVRG